MFEHTVEWTRDTVEIEGLDQEPSVARLATRARADEPSQLRLDRPLALGRLALQDSERGELALFVDDALDLVDTEGPNQLVLEIEIAGEEAEPFHVLQREAGPHARTLETAPVGALLTDVAQSSDTHAPAPGPERAQIPEHVGRTTDRHDRHTGGDEIDVAPAGQCLDGGLVAHTLHEQRRLPSVDHLPQPRRIPVLQGAHLRASRLLELCWNVSMDVAGLLLDLFGRVPIEAREAVEGLDRRQLLEQPNGEANPIAWLVWHLTRVQDAQITDMVGGTQVWISGDWAPRFGLEPDPSNHGYGHTPDQVRAVQPESPHVLLEYLDAVQAATESVLHSVTEAELDRIVDHDWDPPVTMGVRLISIADDCIQHAGQAAYVRGLLSSR